LFSSTKGTDVTLWTLSLENGAMEAFGNVHSTQPTNAVFSPDGRWVAYGSDEFGTPAVYVQPFPATGVKYQVSRGDVGHHAVWSGDGKRLFYIPGPGQLVFVNVATQSGFSFSEPIPVRRGFTIGNSQTAERNHDVASDGRLLGMVSPGQETGATAPQRIDVVLNWFEELKARVPAK
jgi:Tol biopolymer transport system component